MGGRGGASFASRSNARLVAVNSEIAQLEGDIARDIENIKGEIYQTYQSVDGNEEHDRRLRAILDEDYMPGLTERRVSELEYGTDANADEVFMITADFVPAGETYDFYDKATRLYNLKRERERLEAGQLTMF